MVLLKMYKLNIIEKHCSLGIFFLSGGQSEKMSTDNLEAINKQVFIK